MINDDAHVDIQLIIPPAIAEIMDRALITAEDARRTIAYCESTGVKLLDNGTGDFVGHLRNGSLTYWVRYRREGDTFLLVSIYTHRVKIEEDSL